MQVPFGDMLSTPWMGETAGVVAYKIYDIDWTNQTALIAIAGQELEFSFLVEPTIAEAFRSWSK